MIKMNKRKLFILAGVFFLTVANVSAGDNEKGIEYFRAELYDAAKIFFLQQTNQSAAEQAQNYYYLGQTYYRLNQADSASYCYQKSVEILPEYPFGYIGQGKMELQKGNTKAAEDLFKKASNFGKKDPSVQTAIAEAYVTIDDLTNANIALDKARKINTKYSGIYVVEGDILMKQGKVGEACGRYDNAILFDNTDKVAYLKIAQVYKDINTAESLKYLDKLVTLDPNYIPAYALIGDINREERRYRAALDAYEKFIAVPGVPLLQHERYAQLLFFTEQYSKALNHIQYVLTKDPNNLVMKRLEAYNSYRLENYDVGFAQMNQFLKDMPKEKHIFQDYLYLGQLAVKEKQSKVAFDAFKKAIELDSTHVELYKEIAAAASKLGLYPEAITCYEKYLALDPEANTMDYFSYGQANYSAAAYYVTNTDSVMDEVAFKNYVKKGDAAFAEVAKRKPELYNGYLWRANINALLDKYEGDKTGGKVPGYAKPFFEEALKVMLSNNADGARNKDIINAYRYLLSYYGANNDNPNVIDYCKRILQIDPNDEQAQKTLKILKVKL